MSQPFEISRGPSLRKNRRLGLGLEGCELFLRADLFRNHIAAAFINFVRPRIAFRANHFGNATVEKDDRAIILDRDSSSPGPPNQIPKIFPPGNSPGHAVVVRAVDSLDEPEASHVYIFPFSRVIEGHRIGMSGIEPAD